VKAPEPFINKQLKTSVLDTLRLNMIPSNRFQSKSLSLRIASELAKKPKPRVQRTNCLVFEQGSGSVVHISQLQKLEEQGAVLLRTFSTNGKFQAETLTRLPDAVRKCVDVSVIHPVSEGSDMKLTASTDRAYVVLNKQHQKVYTAEDINDNILPAVIEREKRSIPTFVNSVRLHQGMARGFENYYRVQSITYEN
jgi:hypothetical protein